MIVKTTRCEWLKIILYRLRPKSKSVRTYTSCCHTTAVCILRPESLAINNENVMINFNTITPTFECPKSHSSESFGKKPSDPLSFPMMVSKTTAAFLFGYCGKRLASLLLAQRTIMMRIPESFSLLTPRQ